ncbi:hypothetical protein ASPWEDRAFT_112834 [Aspergillus wentii DTO 134E9]|uniref:Zn(2)-C6 fungal-type domain-containing protein n=1 Tax=Aspergillus wentii DTO 134E9 TaxID=1073089 RepID=A0A1L9RI23_ASPWE|nr:uncharacterized protein ASPWEDRAFT_112834 [Aspergillus wentii DTO 134E9]OJJ34571.1 hypothetical protein ASPWEDRAFT_112834 [Aspergillus wentii DTO 134E9]
MSRMFACVLCQRRKVRCDRNVPCANCLRSQAQCIPSDQLPRRRKRRFPERQLLERLHEYERLLRQNNVKFDPLHGDSAGDHNIPSQASDRILQSEPPSDREPGRSSSPVVKSATAHEAKDVWHAINQAPDNGGSMPDYMDENLVKKAWDQAYGNIDPIFGISQAAVDLSFLQPEPAQIFRLWQIYLDNVDPLLKVTHTHTTQNQIVEAVSNLSNVDPGVEALMFSIYCVAMLSLASEECEVLLGSPKQALLAKFQSACQQALVNCGFLRSDNRNCLVAFFFYLISVRPFMDPRSLSSMLGIAVRMAQRMGIHSESECSKHPPFEAEMRRRLWWSLVLFDSRIGEMAADHRSTILTPLWDTKIPWNVNDIDLRPDIKVLPTVQAPLTETLFVVVRSEVADFVRHAAFHLDFTNPVLKALVTQSQQTPRDEHRELTALERMIEGKYFMFTDPENPLHFMATWMVRGYLAKFLLMEHHSRYSTTCPTDDQRDSGVRLAMRRLESDTKVMFSPLTRRYGWLLDFHLPFPAYVHILQDLKRRPFCKHAERAWEVVTDNFTVRSMALRMAPGPIFESFTKLVLQAWGACEAHSIQREKSLTPPRIVPIVRSWLAENAANVDPDQPSHAFHNDISFGGVSVDFAQQGLPGW